MHKLARRTISTAGHAVHVLTLPARFNSDLLRCPKPTMRLNAANTFFVSGGGVVGSEYDGDVHFHQKVLSIASQGMPPPHERSLVYVPFYYSRRHGCLASLDALQALLAEFASLLARWARELPQATFFMHASSACSCKFSCNPLAGTPLAARLRVLTWEQDPEENIAVPHVHEGPAYPPALLFTPEAAREEAAAHLRRPVLVLSTAGNRSAACTHCSVCARVLPGSCTSGCHNIRPQLAAVMERHIAERQPRVLQLSPRAGDYASTHHASTLIRNATFCLQPAGDMLTRSALYLSLMLGCIPVVFRDDDAFWRQYALAHTVPYREMSVHVPLERVRAGLDFVTTLAALPAGVVRAKQAPIARWSATLDYERGGMAAILSEVARRTELPLGETRLPPMARCYAANSTKQTCIL